MKKFFTLTGLVAVMTMATSNANAQHELKTNVAGLIFNQFGLTYEYVVGEEMGALVSVAYFTPPSSFAYDYSAFSITPEFRFYFNPDEDASGYFAGGYLKYRNTSADEYTTYWTDPMDPDSEVVVGQNTNGVALGITGGRKWVTRAGFMFETWAGFGRYLINSKSYTNGYEPGEFENMVDDLPSWDFRVGIVVGWRFGD